MARKLTANVLAVVKEATDQGLSARQIAARVGISGRSVATRSRLREQGRLPAYTLSRPVENWSTLAG
jgi:FixJ family two-component response regulator